MTNNNKNKYMADLQKKLSLKLDEKNVMALPHLTKIVINCGMGEALKDKKSIESMSNQLATIIGQKPKVTKAKKAISSYKLREGDAIGLTATLRGSRMMNFFKKLYSIALPRVRDFRGVSGKSFDGHGNYTLGISEQTIFPDLDYNLVDRNRGFEITFVTTAKDDRSSRILLEEMGLPFEKI